MMHMKLKAKHEFRYGGRRLKVGEEFEARNANEAKLLIGSGRALDAEKATTKQQRKRATKAPAPPAKQSVRVPPPRRAEPPQQPPKEEPNDGTYQRRDIDPESDEETRRYQRRDMEAEK
jgi:hypothetical protein